MQELKAELENAGNELLGQLYKEHKNQKEYIEQLETKLYGQEELLRKALEKNANQKTEIEDLQEKLGSINSNTLVKFIKKILSAENIEEKKRACLENSNCMTILKKIYGPEKFHVTSNAVKKFMNEYSPDFFLEPNKKFQDVENYTNVFSLLEALSEKKGPSGHKSYFAIGRFIHTYCKDQESKNLVFNILDKNLKIGLNNKNFNKIFPGGKFVGFQVALSHMGNVSDLEKLFQNQETWYASRKMDGVRCIIKISPNAESIVLYSRTGKIFHSLKAFEKKFERLYRKNIDAFSSDTWSNGIVMDGEVCLLKNQDDGSYKETFAESIQIKKGDGFQLNKPRFFLFDCLTLKEFEDKKGDRCFGERYKFMKKLFKSFKSVNIILIDQIEIKSKETLKEYIDKGFNEEWEGIIIRKDTGYEGKRSNSFLKFKTYQEVELTVKDVKFDKMMVSINNKMEEREVLSKVIVDYQGNDVGVGSGFTNEQRIKYKENPDLIKGKEVTIKYFEESTSRNKTGKSLRFPILKTVWEEGKRNI
ncbi:4448_t:CDS:2 [Entrophospora sp. SA101]|nr:4448_t:CDS:2 [Entrophospora sp. SA101]